MSDATDRRARVALSGAAGVVVLLALAALRFVGWPIDGIQEPPYRGETWFVAGLMTAAAVAALVRPRLARPALAVAAACAIQLVGTGITARRRWFTSAGFGTAANNMDELRTVAALLTVVAALAAAICAGALVVTRHAGPAVFRWRLAIGAAVAVVAPLAMGWEPWNRTTQIGGHGLMYGPWGVAIALAALLPLRQRITVDAGVVACGIATVLGDPMIPAPRAWVGVAVLIIGAIAANASDHTVRVATSSSSAVSAVGEANA